MSNASQCNYTWKILMHFGLKMGAELLGKLEKHGGLEHGGLEHGGLEQGLGSWEEWVSDTALSQCDAYAYILWPTNMVETLEGQTTMTSLWAHACKVQCERPREAETNPGPNPANCRHKPSINNKQLTSHKPMGCRLPTTNESQINYTMKNKQKKE